MERKVPFVVGEIYHAYTRGVDKRPVCLNRVDFERLQLLLYLCNSKKSVTVRNLFQRYQGEPLVNIFTHEDRDETLVDILAYALMPNHFHLLLKEKTDGGISAFMLKLMTAYSMFFNTKYERSGPLFTRPFRSRHVDTDPYLRWVMSYILLNPLELHQPGWKESSLHDLTAAKKFLQTYTFCSFQDSLGVFRPESKILQTSATQDLGNLRSVDALLAELALHQGEPLVKRGGGL